MGWDKVRLPKQPEQASGLHGLGKQEKEEKFASLQVFMHCGGYFRSAPADPEEEKNDVSSAL